MQVLPLFFPRRPRPRAVVHAGTLLLESRDASRALERLLERFPDRPSGHEAGLDLFLIHPGEPELRQAAESAGVTDITLDVSTPQEADAIAEMALALRAEQLDFTIDDQGVRKRSGEVVPRLTPRAAAQMSREKHLDARVRAKLRAGCRALNRGLRHVRIGSPDAIARQRATEIVHPSSSAPSLRFWPFLQRARSARCSPPPTRSPRTSLTSLAG